MAGIIRTTDTQTADPERLPTRTFQRRDPRDDTTYSAVLTPDGTGGTRSRVYRDGVSPLLVDAIRYPLARERMAEMMLQAGYAETPSPRPYEGCAGHRHSTDHLSGYVVTLTRVQPDGTVTREDRLWVDDPCGYGRALDAVHELRRQIADGTLKAVDAVIDHVYASGTAPGELHRMI